MLKKAGLLTRPTPARRDAPCPKQGRNSAVDPRFTFHGCWERAENAAGGHFQHPANDSADRFNSLPTFLGVSLSSSFFTTPDTSCSIFVAICFTAVPT